MRKITAIVILSTLLTTATHAQQLPEPLMRLRWGMREDSVQLLVPSLNRPTSRIIKQRWIVYGNIPLDFESTPFLANILLDNKTAELDAIEMSLTETQPSGNLYNQLVAQLIKRYGKPTGTSDQITAPRNLAGGKGKTNSTSGQRSMATAWKIDNTVITLNYNQYHNSSMRDLFQLSFQKERVAQKFNTVKY